MGFVTRALLLFLLLGGCRPSPRTDLARIHGEMEQLQVSLKEAKATPSVTDENVFGKFLVDGTTAIPDFAYVHVMKKLQGLKAEAIAAQAEGDLPYKDCMEDPTAFRGKYYRVIGTIVSLRYEKVGDPELPGVFSGACLVAPGRTVLFHLLEKPDVLHLEEDTIVLHGMFVKTVTRGPPDRSISGPLFFARSAKRIL